MQQKTIVGFLRTMDPRGVEIDPLDCDSYENDRLIVLRDDPDDLCVLCLGLWDFRVSSDAGKSKYQKHYEKKTWEGPGEKE